MDRATFIEITDKIKEAILRVGGKFYSYDIGSPAPKELFERLKVVYGIDFPLDFVNITTTVAARVNISWNIYNDRGRELSKSLSFLKKGDSIFSGELRWDAEKYLSEDELKIYRNPCNDPELIGKLHLFDVPNGDMVMFDMTGEKLEKPIIYLSHDEFSGETPQLAPSFADYMSNLLAIGLVGSDFEQTKYFVSESTRCIDQYLPTSQEWRRVIGLSF